MKFQESQFPAKEKSLAQPGPASLNNCQFSKILNQSDLDNDLGLVTLDQPLEGQTSPRQPAQTAQPSQPLILPLAPLGGSRLTLPDVGTTPTP